MEKKYSFKNDYSELAHPEMLKAIVSIGEDQVNGYGEDIYCQKATENIIKMVGNDADVHFVTGGTQANLLVISSALRPHEAVIAVESSHIFVHETGAIEYTGHKICTILGENGKVTVDGVKSVLAAHSDEHMVKPRLVFISNSTEVGTVYSHAELKTLSDFCHKNNLLLYLDGARLGVALTCTSCDLTLADIAKLTDAFYIGGTKNGALLGEAIVLTNPALKADFRYLVKQKGALLAKGAVVGIQFHRFFEDNLYFNLATHANQMAKKLTQGIRALGYGFLEPCQTNQIFPIFPNRVIDALLENYEFYIWSRVDDETSSVRLVTSWATETSVVDAFLGTLEAL